MKAGTTKPMANRNARIALAAVAYDRQLGPNIDPSETLRRLATV